MPSAYKIKPSQVRQGEKRCQHGTHAQRCRGTGTGGSTQLGRRSLTRDTTLELRLAPRKQQLGQQLSLGSGVGWPEAGCDGAGAELRVRRQLWGHGGPRGEEGSAGELPWGSTVRGGGRGTACLCASRCLPTGAALPQEEAPNRDLLIKAKHRLSPGVGLGVRCTPALSAHQVRGADPPQPSTRQSTEKLSAKGCPTPADCTPSFDASLVGNDSPRFTPKGARSSFPLGGRQKPRALGKKIHDVLLSQPFASPSSNVWSALGDWSLAVTCVGSAHPSTRCLPG